MKNLISVVVLAVSSAIALAQTCVPGGGVTCTPNLQLWELPAHYPNWNIYLNTNAALIDTASANWAKLSAVNQTFVGTVTAASFVGPLHGNADTATAAATLTYTGSAVLTFALIAPGAYQTQQISIPGAVVANHGVNCSPQAGLAGGGQVGIWTSFMLANGVVSVAVVNVGAGAWTPNTVMWGCSVVQ